MAEPQVKLPVVGQTPIVPILLLGFGAYLAWFGVRYWRKDIKWPSDPVKSILQGKGLPDATSADPESVHLAAEVTSAQQAAAQAQADAQQAAAAGSAGGSTGTGQAPGTTTAGGRGSGPSGPGETAWITAFLAAIGAPPTPANIDSISNWIRHEGPYGTQGPNNPMNTKQPEPGSWDWYQGVQGYPSPAVGIEALASTLMNGNYGDILLYLRSGQGLCGKQLAGLSTWSGGGYSQVC